jgi:hypothetical protein
LDKNGSEWANLQKLLDFMHHIPDLKIEVPGREEGEVEKGGRREGAGRRNEGCRARARQ